LHAPIYESRIAELVRQIVPHLEPGDRVLDVGCGGGALGAAILEANGLPPGVSVRGLERFRRGAEAIPVDAYDGGKFPYADGAFEVVILADVLHHEAEPHRLIGECQRVASRLLVVKDHKIDGPLAWLRISLLDWLANTPYGVACTYRYNTPDEWSRWHSEHGLTVERELSAMRLYPEPFNLVFGGRLQYLALLRPNHQPAPTASP
jgi:2-polyprenyl-3-methyl-5-hydroxy-6-metoxy-1,4-benzoquinol methylase